MSRQIFLNKVTTFQLFQLSFLFKNIKISAASTYEQRTAVETYDWLSWHRLLQKQAHIKNVYFMLYKQPGSTLMQELHSSVRW